MHARPLPPCPNLQQYKKQAKDLLKACKSNDPTTLREWTAAWMKPWANEWTQTQARLRGVEAPASLRAIFDGEMDGIEQHLRETMANPSVKLTDAQLFIARAHGFESWPRFSKHIEEVARGNSTSSKFEAAADAVVAGDTNTLERLLHENPELIHGHSNRQHRATLLHYISANSVEDFRQKTPKNAVEVLEILIKAGADLEAVAESYGGSKALDLVATSFHPAKAGVQLKLMNTLLNAGARVEGFSGKNIIKACLANGRGQAAEFLASRGARLDLETAAGVGQLDVVTSFFNDDGTLNAQVTKQQMDAGFGWACEYGRKTVVEFLLDKGVDILAQPHGGAALHQAVVGGQLEIINLLIARGAPLEVKNVNGGTVLGQALWSAMNGDPTVDYVSIIHSLLVAGAIIEDGSLAWLNEQGNRPAATKARLAAVLQNHGAKS